MIRKERYIMEITTSHRSRERTIQIFFIQKEKLLCPFKSNIRRIILTLN